MAAQTTKVTGGITNTFQYKNLSLLIHVDGKFGGKVFSSTALNGLRSGHEPGIFSRSQWSCFRWCAA